MSDCISRKEFLRLSAWGFLAAVVPYQDVLALSFITENKKKPNQTDYERAVELAQTGKEYFLSKKYSEAEEIYLECISLAPAAIRFYDNLDNVYGAQGKFFSSAQLFKNGLSVNPSQISFYDRAARSLMRLETGYRNLAEDFRNLTSSTSLLLDAKQLYLDAISIDPKPYLSVGLAKIQRKIDEDATNKDYRKDSVLKAARQARILNHRLRYNKTPAELLVILSNIDNKNRNKLYIVSEIQNRERNINKEKKIIFRKLIDDNKQIQDYSLTLQYAEALYNLDKKDSKSFSLYKKQLLNANLLATLVPVYKEYALLDDRAYSTIGMITTINKAYLNNGASLSDVDYAIARGEKIFDDYILNEQLECGLVQQLSRAYCCKGDFATAKLIHEQFMNRIHTSLAYVVYYTILSYARVFYVQGDYISCEKILLQALDTQLDAPIEDFQIIKAIKQNVLYGHQDHSIDLLYLLYNTYNQSGQTAKAVDTLSTILTIYPGNPFAIKRS